MHYRQSSAFDSGSRWRLLNECNGIESWFWVAVSHIWGIIGLPHKYCYNVRNVTKIISLPYRYRFISCYFFLSDGIIFQQKRICQQGSKTRLSTSWIETAEGH
ncbi:hypothetical protein Tcan_00990, partial [Toxocara canis]